MIWGEYLNMISAYSLVRISDKAPNFFRFSRNYPVSTDFDRGLAMRRLLINLLIL